MALPAPIATLYVQLVSTTLPGASMDLPKYESVHLQRSPLVLVAAQINFEEVAQEVKHPQARAIQRAMTTKIWTTLQSAPQVRTTLTPHGAVNEPNRQAYRLLSRDGAWSTVVNPDSVILETRAYTGWAEMFARLTDLAQAVATVLDPAQRLRLGLRYVDQVAMPNDAESWEGLIPDSLLGVVRDDRYGASILGSEQRHLLQLDGDARCLLRHGLLPDSEGRPYGAYLLDYDVFSDAAAVFDAGEVSACAARLHSYAGALFRITVTDRLYEWLKG